jgi:short-subunit dehydrogenase
MELSGSRILLTGARGGLGAEIATLLEGAGARLCRADIRSTGDDGIVAADISKEADRSRLTAIASARLGAVDILVNAAGINPFGLYHQQAPAVIESVMAINAVAPMLLARSLLPGMMARGQGRIVNIGSTFGTIAFGCFSAYSASKFALRGFSQALRREIRNSGVGVTHISPRAIRTPINDDAVYEMAAEIGMTFDEPSAVAERIVRAIVDDEDELYIGFPESLFARINAVAPGFVDRAVEDRHAVMRRYAARDHRDEGEPARRGRRT